MEKLRSYLKVTYEELMHKVSWPTWSDLQSSTIIVMIAALIISLIIYLIDLAGGNLLNVFYQFFKV